MSLFDQYGVQIKEAFDKLDIKLSPTQITNTIKLVQKFENRGLNPLTLNSQLFGVHEFYFRDVDKYELFAIFKVTEKQIITIIDDILALNYARTNGRFTKTDFKVGSNPFNVFCIWLIHLGLTNIKNKKDQYLFCVSVAKYLQYRFFTSVVNQCLRYGADEGVMQAVVNDLSNKYDVISEGTWKNTIELSSTNLIDQTSIHYKTLITVNNDEAFRYVITDMQTRIKQRVINICEKYYEYHKKNSRISTVKTVGIDEDGNGYVIERSSNYETMMNTILTSITNKSVFVNMSVVNQVCSQFTNIRSDLLVNALNYISDQASFQMRSNDMDNFTKNKDGTVVFTGLRLLISSILRYSFRYAMKENIQLSQKHNVWISLKNAYTSSRILDPNIQNIKNSVAILVDEMNYTSREATKSSLRITIIMYVILKGIYIL